MDSHFLQKIENGNSSLGWIIREPFSTQGIHFFTDEKDTLQIGYMSRPQNYVIFPHVHNPVKREVLYTEEVLFIKKGRVRVDFYDEKKNYLKSTILNPGDIVLLATGGHGFEMLEDSEIIEVKQGPYCNEQDKTRFDPIDSEKLIIENQ